MNVYEVYKLEIYHFFLTVYVCGAAKLSIIASIFFCVDVKKKKNKTLQHPMQISKT